VAPRPRSRSLSLVEADRRPHSQTVRRSWPGASFWLTGWLSGSQTALLSAVRKAFLKQIRQDFSQRLRLSALQSDATGPNQSRSCKDCGGRGPPAARVPRFLQRLRLPESARGGRAGGGLGLSRLQLQAVPQAVSEWRRRKIPAGVLPQGRAVDRNGFRIRFQSRFKTVWRRCARQPAGLRSWLTSKTRRSGLALQLHLQG